MIKRDRLPVDIRVRLPRLIERFGGDQQVTALYLFGSFARGAEDALSDLDLAILFDPKTPPVDLGQLTLDYLVQINRLLVTDEVSFLVLNTAPLTLRYEVVHTGKVLVDNDPAVRLSFELYTEDLYMDFKPLLDAYDDALLEQLTTATG